MVSLPDDRLQSEDGSSSDRQHSSNSSTDWIARADREQMFQLIDSILPFEVCLYHQVLPLSVSGSRLNLGMVDPGDRTALDYVRRLVSYINCSIVSRQISSEVLQTLLSAYLNYADKKKQAPSPKSRPSANKRIIEPPAPSPELPPLPETPNLQPTLIVDSPEELLETDAHLEMAEWEPPKRTLGQNQMSLAAQEPATVSEDNWIAPNLAYLDPSPLESTPQALADNSPILPARLNLPVLEVKANHLSSPSEVLAVLPPKNLVHELLARVLAGGIGRLFFERQSDQGRVLWSQDGILQSVLEGIPSVIFQGAINELKQLTELPLLPVQKPRQVEIERVYQDERLLLRFRVMPGTHGEEATLQVLRGAALKFHQQQQLATLGRDALGIAQQLQRKLSEICDRVTAERLSALAQIESLEALEQMLQNMRQQIQALSTMSQEEN
ncbi:MAG: hypothetical protein SFW36_13200 [Leptolyngbyaceae cyanobacterium bins.59]|nr:hypothetical protein [Leptolyngbyaceae cyanobacterium bins.59]